MQFDDFKTVSCDILIIGGGGAGLKAAIEAREMGADVLVVSKSRVGYGNNTFISKGTFAASGWGDALDGLGTHLKDTVIGGRFLNNQELVTVMAREVTAQVTFLEKCGVNFLKKEGNIRVDRAAGHSYPRHVRGENRIGRDFILPLKKRAEKIGVRFADRVFVTKLFTRNNRIAAASGVSENGIFHAFKANCVILATGGFAQIYLHTNNAPGITGDGLALAFDLGLPLKDMEFVQFYPTALGKFGNRMLLYEAFVLQEGALLKNALGEDVVAKYGLRDPLVMTRDRLAQAVMNEITEGLDVDGGVVMDLSTLSDERAAQHRPLLPPEWSKGQKEFIVSPTTHFCMGGIIIGKDTETPVPGLFAAGEVCGGVHGANRLGGNALSEVFTMGGIAGRNAALKAREIGTPDMPEDEIAEEKARLGSCLPQAGQGFKTLHRTLKEVMWHKAGIVRHRKDLDDALKRVKELTSPGLKPAISKPRELIRYLELQNMLLLAEMVCRAALLRTESRGSHYRSDYPEEDNTHWLKNIIIRKEDTGMRLESVPVSLGVVTPEDPAPS